jgi:phosphate-selective porin OprO/OprP
MIFSTTFARAEEVIPASATINAPRPLLTPPTSSGVDVQAIYHRLEQQEAEIRQLRAQLGTLHEEMHYLPPVDVNPNEALPINSNLSNADVLHRLDAMEQRLDQQAAQQKAALESTVEGYEIGSDLSMTASWANGLELRTKNKDFRVHIGGRTQFDMSAFGNDPELTVPREVGGIGPQPNSVQLRRARLRIDGTMYEVFDWAAEYDFANALANALPQNPGQPVAITPVITDLWITWTQLPTLGNVRVGNVKEPIGMEHIQSSRWLDFIERSFWQDAIFGPFNNGFNPGFYAFNWTDDEMGTWAGGVFANNSDPFGYSIGDDWALTGRVTRLLYYDEPSQGRYLWHVGVSGSVRKPDEDLVRVRTRGNIRSGPPSVLNPIYGDTGTMLADRHELVGMETAAVWGPLSMQGEYVCTWVENALQPYEPPQNAVSHGTPLFHGGYVQLMYFLTGEHRAYNRRAGVFDRVVPFGNAFCVDSSGGRCHGRGAWQIGARYGAIDLNDNGINGGILHSCTLGLNWFLNPNAKIQFNYDITHRSQVQDVPPGIINAFGIRFAHDF